jgi:hypothetical protein
MKLLILSFVFFLYLTSCSSGPSAVNIFENDYIDFLIIKDKLLEDSYINSIWFDNSHKYRISISDRGSIFINDKRKEYYINKGISYADIHYDLKESLFYDLGMTIDMLSDYFSFFKEHSAFSALRYYTYISRSEKILDENIKYFSSDVLEKIKLENIFLEKINKNTATFRFIDFIERMNTMLLGDVVAICFSPDIDLSGLSQEELSIFGFKWIRETSYQNWYEVAY